MQKLSDGDKSFIKLTESGTKPSPAFREAYPDHVATLAYLRTEPGSPDRQKASSVLKDAAMTKLKAKYMTDAIETYADKMEKFSDLSLKTATDLVQNARSEKVRSDLAIEGIRHRVGSPTVKALVKEEKTVYLTFGDPPADGDVVRDRGEIIDI